MEKLWTRNYTLLVAVSVLMAFPVSMMNTAVPLFAAAQGMNPTLVGLMTTVFTVGIVLTRPFFGAIIDRFGRLPILIAGAALFTALATGMRWAAAPLMLLLLRLFQGVGYAAYSTSTGTMVTDLTPAPRLVEGVGFFTVFTTIAVMSLGPALAVQLTRVSFAPVFWAAGAIGLIGALTAFLLNHERNRPRPVAGPLSLKMGDILEFSIMKLSIANTCIALTTGVINTFLPVWALAQGVGNIWLYFLVNAAAMLLSRLFVKLLLRSVGTMGVILGGITLLALAILCIGLAHSLPLFLLAAALNGFGFGINNPVVNSLSYRLCPENRRGVATATLYGTFDGGTGIGALIGGALSQWTGYGIMFVVFIAALAASAALFLIWVRPQMVRQGVADREG